MNKKLYIVGPTASGKTDLALSISKVIHGDLLNADSRQVYKRLDIISGKDIPYGSAYHSDIQQLDNQSYDFGYYSLEGTKLYLLDIVEPTYNFSVHNYVLVERVVEDRIISSHKLPIIVGGSGFYVKALLDGVETHVIPPDRKLRQKLQSYRVAEIQSILQKENQEKFDSLNNSDRKNPVRLIRAIEITKSKIKVDKEKMNNNSDNLLIGLIASREILKKRIDERVQKRIQQGAFEEAEKLFNEYEKLSVQVKTGNGYRQLFYHFLGTSSKEETVERWKRSEYLTAKKQVTWFKKDKRIIWFDIEDANFEKRVNQKILSWYNT